MKVKDITAAIEQMAPLYLQEDYDNSGMQVGDPEAQVTGVLLCTDVRMPVVDEAIGTGANLIISHHPLIFHGIKKITGRSYIEQIIIKAIKHGIAIYSAHTNLDNARYGVSWRMATKLGLQHVRVLDAQRGTLRKVVTFVPTGYASQVEQAMWEAGAGQLGDYDQCSYRMQGMGQYSPLPGAHPAMGLNGEHHQEPETRIEVLVHSAHVSAVIAAMLQAHPYEEPAFDVLTLGNEDPYSGSGVVGDLPRPVPAVDFLQRLKQAFEVATVRYSGVTDGRMVSRVALCGGAGSFLIGKAMQSGAQVFVTGDLKYHDFQGQEERIILADIGHYESEHYTKEIFYEIIQKKSPKFAVAFASTEKNQVKYL